MKNFGRTSSPAAVAGALALLAAAPPPASAQAVRGYLSPGGLHGGTPIPNLPPQQVVMPPMRSGAVPAPTGGAFGPSPGFNQPNFNRPVFNRPVFSPPGYGTSNPNPPNFNPSVFDFHPPVYGNGLNYNSLPNPNSAPVYNNGSAYGSGSVYGNGRAFRGGTQAGPVVSVPDPFAGLPSGDRRLRSGRFGGTSNGVSGLPGYPFGARSDYSNGYPNGQDIRPVGSAASGYRHTESGNFGGSGLHTFTPGAGHGPTTVYRNTYIYNNYNPAPVVVNAPPLLGGYYYGNYCDVYVPAQTYPSVYSVYAGFPGYIYTVGSVVVAQPLALPYVTDYLPFSAPSYPVTYNQNNYYVSSESRAREIEGGGVPARAALKSAYPADSYQAAFADIARAWTDGDIAPLRRHIRDTDTRVSVFLNKKYSYSIASGDFVQITRDALSRLHTVSFDFTRLRKAKTGDVTAYGAHVYRTGDGQTARDGDTVPFDQSGADPNATGQEAAPYDKSGDPAVGTDKTVYVSYTLRHRDGQWYIVEVDSADHALVPEQ